MTESKYNPIGCGGIAGFVFLFFVVLAIGWFTYDTFRPRHPIDVLFQRVINEAAISDHFTPGRGWDRVNVSDRICGQVNRETLDAMGLESSTASDFGFAGQPEYLENADVWHVRQRSNIFAECSNHSIRYLTIGMQQGTDQCGAVVTAAPTCDP